MPVREALDGTLTGPGGTWRDVLTGAERSLDGEVNVAELVRAQAVGLFERVA